MRRIRYIPTRRLREKIPPLTTAVETVPSFGYKLIDDQSLVVVGQFALFSPFSPIMKQKFNVGAIFT